MDSLSLFGPLVTNNLLIVRGPRAKLIQRRFGELNAGEGAAFFVIRLKILIYLYEVVEILTKLSIKTLSKKYPEGFNKKDPYAIDILYAAN